jgi:CDP-4-dehydro-6-deoxyglucose reductase
MAWIELNNGAGFEANPGESLLDAALRAKVGMAYSCRTGRCSTCKCRVLAGSSVVLQDELGLSAREQADGWILGCVRSAQGDMRIEAEDLGGVVLPQPKTLPCRIDALERVAPDVLRVVLRLPPTGEFAYLPGQYIEIIKGDLRRSYSLASADAANKRLELHVRAVEGGAMSAYWFGQAKVNDLLRLHGPLGSFFLREVARRDLVFLATGTGIAPVKAMLEQLGRSGPAAQARSVTVYWGGRTPADLYCELPGGVDGWRFVPVLSRADDSWHGARGHVQQVLLAQGASLADADVYACGSPAMIASAKEALTRAGLPESCFRSDAFVCSDKPTSTHTS